LGFLGSTPYRAMLVRDDPDNAASERVERVSLTRHGSLTINLRTGGGFIGWLTPRITGAKRTTR